MIREQARREATAIARQHDTDMAIVETRDEHTGRLTYEFCPLPSLAILYRVQINARIASLVELIRP